MAESSDTPSSGIHPEMDEERIERIALYYAEGDRQKALQMIDGEYKDMYALKVTFSSTSLFGAYLVFFNHFFCGVRNSYGIISSSYIVKDIDNSLPWVNYEKKIASLLTECDYNKDILLQMSELMRSGISLSAAKELSEKILQNDKIGVEGIFRHLITTGMGFENVHVSVVREDITSLDMEIKATSGIKVSDEILERSGFGKKKAEGKEDFEVVLEEEENKLVNARNVKHILNGECVLSPIRGMQISGLVVGDIIKVRITDSSPVVTRIALAFDAYDDGKVLPVPGRVISFRHLPKGGFKIFVAIAKGVVVRITEEEENIKVELVSASADRPPELQKDIEKYMDQYVKKKPGRAQKRKSPQSAENDGSKKGSTGVQTTSIISAAVIITIVAIIIIIFFLVKS